MNTFKHIHIVAILALIFITGCKKDPKTDSNRAEAKVYLDVAYSGDAFQKMDVYLPENRSNSTPVVLMLHGGGFIAGDKREFSEHAANLSAKGYVVLNTNYRLVDSTGALRVPVIHKSSAVKIVDQLADLDAAVNFAISKSSEWVMSTDRWAMAGHSAGATLSLLYSYGDKNKNKRIKAVGNWAGATNFAFNDESEAAFLDPRLVEIFYRAVGHEVKNANKLAYMSVSPYWVASANGGIPTINIRPENNVVIGPDYSKAEYQALTTLLNSKATPNKSIEVTGADHGFSKAGNWNLVISETDAFFKAYLK